MFKKKKMSQECMNFVSRLTVVRCPAPEKFNWKSLCTRSFRPAMIITFFSWNGVSLSRTIRPISRLTFRVSIVRGLGRGNRLKNILK